LAPIRDEHLRLAPSARLAPYVAHFWWVSWDVDEPRVVETLPHPTLHIAFESPDFRPELSGVSVRRFTRTLEGRARVFALKLRPAVFGVLAKEPISSFRDRRTSAIGTLVSLSLEEALEELGRRLAQCENANEAVTFAETLLGGAEWPELPDPARQTRDLVERIETDRRLVRVSDLADAAALDERTLERRFRRYVGLSPKVVLARYRLIEAAERLREEDGLTLAALAADLGYTDHAHFSRDFRAFVGRTPSEIRTARLAENERRPRPNRK
jgi:AraC-like DNA-binding protein